MVIHKSFVWFINCVQGNWKQHTELKAANTELSKAEYRGGPKSKYSLFSKIKS